MEFKELRLLTGLSQEEFSKKYNVPKSTVSKWEQGISKVPEHFIRMALYVEAMEKKTGISFTDMDYQKNDPDVLVRFDGGEEVITLSGNGKQRVRKRLAAYAEAYEKLNMEENGE